MTRKPVSVAEKVSKTYQPHPHVTQLLKQIGSKNQKRKIPANLMDFLNLVLQQISQAQQFP